MRQLEREYQSSRSTAGRAADFLTTDQTTAGEKFLGVAEPVVSGAARAADIITRPLQAASSGFWSGVRKRDLGAAYDDAKTELLTGETPEGAGNYLAEKVAGSETLRDINPNLPGMAAAVTEMLADPTNLLPAGLLTKTGRGLVGSTKTFQRVEQALQAAGDARVADFFRRGGRVLNLKVAPLKRTPAAAAGTVATTDAAAEAVPRLLVTVQDAEGRQFTIDTATSDVRETGTTTKPSREWQHADFGLVTESADQAGTAAGRVRVVDAQGNAHVIKFADGTGAGNQRAIPVKPATGDEAAKARAAAEQPSAYGAQNRLVSVERVEAARARLRRKLNPTQLNTGLDPCVLADMAEIAAFHVEAGARDFASFSARMIEDAGDDVKPYLRDLFDHSFTRLDLDPEQNTTSPATESVATLARTPLPEIISSVRKAGLLTGLKTHARNVLGTAGFQGAEDAARVPAAVADIVVSMATSTRTVGGADMGAFLYSSRQAAMKGIAQARQIMRDGIDDAGLRQLQVTAELNSGSRILDAYTNTVFRALNAEDRIFRTYAVARSALRLHPNLCHFSFGISHLLGVLRN